MFKKTDNITDTQSPPKVQRTLEGTVVSDKMQKTRTVAVTRQKKHPMYKKYYAVTKKYKAHDEQNAYQTGDIVRIRQIRPMSKDKKWEIIGKVEGAPKKEPAQTE